MAMKNSSSPRLRSSILLRALALALVFLPFAARPIRAETPGTHGKVAFSTETHPFNPKTTYGPFYDQGIFVIDNTGRITFGQNGGGVSDTLFQGTAKLINRGIMAGVPAAGLPGEFVGFNKLFVNASGQFAFYAYGKNPVPHQLCWGSPEGFQQIAADASPVFGAGGQFQTFGTILGMNDAGHVLFQATTAGGPGSGIFLFQPAQGSTAAVKSNVAIQGGAAPEGAFYDVFDSAVAINNLGQVAFVASRRSLPGAGSFLGSALHFGTPGSLVVAASSDVNDFMINNAGQIVFSTGDAVKLATTAGTTQTIATGDPAPDGGTFSSFSKVAINEAGQFAFSALTTGGPGGSSGGIYLWSPGTGLRAVAVKGPAPGDGTFTALPEFSRIYLNEAGQLAFMANTSSGLRVFFADESGVMEVASPGSTWQGLVMNAAWLPHEFRSARVSGHSPLNDHGQLLYEASFNNVPGFPAFLSGLFVFSPPVRWRTAGDGAWDVAANWTSDAVPGATDQAVIETSVDVVVTGPTANATVAALRLGGGAGVSTLDLQPGVTLTCTGGATLAAGGVLTGTGTLGGALTVQDGATLSLALGGRTRGTEYDFLKVTKKLTFGGTLEVVTANAFQPELGDSFDLLDFGSKAGAFQTLTLPPLGSPGLVWDTSALYTTGRISVALAATLPGLYAGLARATPGDAPEGSFIVTLEADGSVKVKGLYRGKAFTTKGRLDAAGAFLGEPFDKAGHRLALQLDLSNTTNEFTGTIQDVAAAVVANVLARRTPVFVPKVAASPFAGSYTVALPTDPAHPEAAYPKGTGYATLTVTTKGSAKLIGVLGDATPFSAGGAITSGGEFTFFAPRYGGLGFVAGTLTLQGPTGSDAVTGTLAWSKPVTKTPKWFPAAFAGEIVVEGSGFVAPPADPSILDLPGGGALTFAEGNVGVIPAQTATLDAQNKVTLAPNAGGKFKFAFVKSPAGRVAGTFPATVAGKTVVVPFKGVTLQKQNRAAGLFKGVGQTGIVGLQ